MYNLGSVPGLQWATYAKLPVEHIRVALSHTRHYQGDTSDYDKQNGIEVIIR